MYHNLNRLNRCTLSQVADSQRVVRCVSNEKYLELTAIMEGQGTISPPVQRNISTVNKRKTITFYESPGDVVHVTEDSQVITYLMHWLPCGLYHAVCITDTGLLMKRWGGFVSRNKRLTDVTWSYPESISISCLDTGSALVKPFSIFSILLPNEIVLLSPPSLLSYLILRMLLMLPI